MKKAIKKITRPVGICLEKYTNPDLKRRIKLINTHEIDTLLDIGANVGRYVRIMRHAGYKNQVISFEPMNAAFEELAKHAKRDKNWIGYNYGLGDENTQTEINISNNSYSSSILNMQSTHLESAPNSKYVAKQAIELKKLDAIFPSICNPASNIMMKIDTQGYEKNVLDGAEQTLKHIRIIQLEMSLVPLYENEMLYLDMILFLKAKGFELHSLENGFSNPTTGQLLQFDGIFVKSSD